ncbi:MAG: hypothetical protein ACFB0Z_06825, partial [Candidatus Phaeomarinobacter sp.]
AAPAAGPGTRLHNLPSHGPPAPLVASVEFVEPWRQPGVPPHIGHRNSNSPPSIVRAWIRDRLNAAPGGPGAADQTVLRVILQDGSVTQTALEIEEGIGGLFRDEADTQIDAVAAVDVEVIDPVAGRIGSVSVKVVGTRKILESSSLNERDRVYFALMEEVANSLNDALENGLNAELGFVIKR